VRFNIFRYREEEPQPGRSPIVRPTVDLTLTYFRNSISARCLVDTGAPFCIFGRALAEALEMDMGLGRGENRLIHILGGSYKARVAMIQLDLPPFVGLSWETEVCFLYDDLDLSFVGVLGQQGFLDKWVASFNLAYGYFVIEESTAFHERLGVDPAEVMGAGYLDSEWERPRPD
jgi:hypothetical protein